MDTINKVTDCIIEECIRREVDDLTPMKMQKLLYFIWVWYAVLYKKSIFNEEPQAWKHGPVFPTIYKQFAPKGKNLILDSDIINGCKGLQRNLNQFIKNVLDKYIEDSASNLRKKSHNQIWENAFNNKKDNTIGLHSAISYYRNNLIEATNIFFDNIEKVWVATSNIIPGLVIESNDYSQLLSSIQENGEILIEENCS